jgi:hypothetical protein
LASFTGKADLLTVGDGVQFIGRKVSEIPVEDERNIWGDYEYERVRRWRWAYDGWVCPRDNIMEACDLCQMSVGCPSILKMRSYRVGLACLAFFYPFPCVGIKLPTTSGPKLPSWTWACGRADDYMPFLLFFTELRLRQSRAVELLYVKQCVA